MMNLTADIMLTQAADLRSRADRLDAGQYVEVVSALRHAADTLDAVADERRWIPCAERMPEEDGDYLVTYKYSLGRIVCVMWLSANDGQHNPMTANAVAWMPLPEPWREENDGA